MTPAHLTSTAALDDLRLAMARFGEAVNAALTSAESEAARVLHWLEGEQTAYWKAAVRKAEEDLAKAREAYRFKAMFKDATGAKQSTVEEQVAVERAIARREECERKAALTKRHIAKIRRDLIAFRGGVQRLMTFTAYDLPTAMAHLSQAALLVDRYAAAQAQNTAQVTDRSGRGAMARPADEPPDEAAQAAVEGGEEGPDDETLRQRTPPPHVRARAPRGPDASDAAPAVSDPARNAARPHLRDEVPGRYDLLSVALPPRADVDAAGDLWAVYLERREATGSADTGWHLGYAGNKERPCGVTTMTVGRLTAGAPALGELMRLPIGSLVVARGSEVGRPAVSRILDPLGRVLWSQGAEAKPGEPA